MKQAIATVIIVIFILVSLGIVVTGSRNKTQPTLVETVASSTEEVALLSNSPILYWGSTCPHCHDTIEWMDRNLDATVVTVERKEVYENEANAQELALKAESCGIDPNQIGVPFLFTSEGNCLVGTPDITAYLESKMSSALSESTEMGAE